MDGKRGNFTRYLQLLPVCLRIFVIANAHHYSRLAGSTMMEMACACDAMYEAYAQFGFTQVTVAGPTSTERSGFWRRR